MRRFLAVFLAVSVVAVAACNRSGENAGAVNADSANAVPVPGLVPPPPPGVVNVNVFCGDPSGLGIGARVNPWRVHTGDLVQVTFNIHPLPPGSFNVSTTLDSVPGSLWAFRDTAYGPDGTGAIAAPLLDSNSLSAGDITYYRLTLTCQPTEQATGGAEVTTIVIDPIVIVDNPPPPGA